MAGERALSGPDARGRHPSSLAVGAASGLATGCSQPHTHTQTRHTHVATRTDMKNASFFSRTESLFSSLCGCDFHFFFCLHVLLAHKEGEREAGDVFSFRSGLAPALLTLYTLSPLFLPLGRDQAKATDQPKNLIVVEPVQLPQPPPAPLPPPKNLGMHFCCAALFAIERGMDVNPHHHQTPTPPTPTVLPKESTPTHSDTSTPLMAFEKLPFKPSKVPAAYTNSGREPPRYEFPCVSPVVTFSPHGIHLQRYKVLTEKKMKGVALGSNPPAPICVKTLCCLSPKRRLLARNLGRSHGMFPAWLRAPRKHSHQG